jgi:hypothetical protein
VSTVHLAVMSAACTFSDCGTCTHPACEHRCHADPAPVPVTGARELRAAARAYDALKLLDHAAAERTLAWLGTRLNDDELRRAQVRYHGEVPF